MPRLKENQVASYRLHKQSGQAIVTLSGRDHLLGTYDTKESRVKYDQLIGEWIANGRRADYRQVEGLTIARILAEFVAHARSYYGNPDGQVSNEFENFRHQHLARGCLDELKSLSAETFPSSEQKRIEVLRTPTRHRRAHFNYGSLQ